MTYETIAAAEQAITSAGFTRDAGRALWVHVDGRTAKVVSAPGNKFAIIYK